MGDNESKTAEAIRGAFERANKQETLSQRNPQQALLHEALTELVAGLSDRHLKLVEVCADMMADPDLPECHRSSLIEACVKDMELKFRSDERVRSLRERAGI